MINISQASTSTGLPQLHRGGLEPSLEGSAGDPEQQSEFGGEAILLVGNDGEIW